MMEIKKFEAPTLAEALKVVKRELGPDAIVLSTKNNRNGWGLMNGSSVEVTATISREALDKKKLAEERLTPEQRTALYKAPSSRAAQAYDILSGSRIQRRLKEASSLLAEKRVPSQAKHASTSSIVAATQTAQAMTQRPITQRRYVDIEDEETPAEQVSLRSYDRAQISREPSRSPRGESSSSLKVLPKILASLIEGGVEEGIVRELGDELKVVMLREHITREDLLRLQLARILMSRIRVARSLGERLRVPSTPRIITFLGPTGVGKTTTIAKIAAELVINQGRPVTLATTDTYKIAAVEQLQTYANILKINLEVCPTAESLSALRDRISQDEVVLVDTAGFGARDEEKLEELKEMLSSIRCEKHLCLSSTTRDSDLYSTLKRFKNFDPDYLVFTKLDETSIFGSILNVAAKSHIPLSYFTMGQRVPEDMEVATKERVADLIMDLAEGGNLWTKQIG